MLAAFGPSRSARTIRRGRAARRAAERALYAARRAAGLCGTCGGATTDGGSRCPPCAVAETARYPRKKAARREEYARRCGVISYSIAHSSQTIILTDPILVCFDRHRQVTADSPEAGGQLFARFDGSIIRVERATGPRPSDHRSPTSFIPNRAAERREIRRSFKKGFHYVGDWPHPSPSLTDIRSFRDMYRKSRHGLAGFLMVIVGTMPGEDGLYVALCNDHTPRRLMTRPDHGFHDGDGLNPHPAGAGSIRIVVFGVGWVGLGCTGSPGSSGAIGETFWRMSPISLPRWVTILCGVAERGPASVDFEVSPVDQMNGA